MAETESRTATEEKSKSYDTEDDTESEEGVQRSGSPRTGSRRDGTESPPRTATETPTEGSPRSQRSQRSQRSGSVRSSPRDTESDDRRDSPRSDRSDRSVSPDRGRDLSVSPRSDRSEPLSDGAYEDLDNVDRRRFAELPQARLYTERRLFSDQYCKGLHDHIETLSHHIEKIQAKEIELLLSFSAETFGKDKALELDKENRNRERAIENIREIRRERMKYRALLFDAIQDRNNLLESREISRREERMIKNRADRIEPWRGVDLYLLLFFASQVAIVILYIIFMDFTNNPLYDYNVINIIGPYQRLVYFYNFGLTFPFSSL